MLHKKQLFNIIEDICKLNNEVWDQRAGSYDDKKEAAYQIEEALEGFTTLEAISQDLTGDVMSTIDSPKEISRMIVDKAYSEDLSGSNSIADVDRFDKHLDSIYFNIGSLHKLGLSPEQIVEGLQVVHDANKQKSGKKDSKGKVIKPTDFINPEPFLQKILDQRG